jgi:ferritin
MKLSKKVGEALNNQFNEELKSALLYFSMAADFESKGLQGIAAWLGKQGGEENGHAGKIRSYLYERGSRVYYQAVEAPQAEWKDTVSAFKDVLKHEQFISDSILKLVKLARSEEDVATEVLLGWFVKEQVEEEATAQLILDKLAMIGDSKVGLYQLDKEMGLRA